MAAPKPDAAPVTMALHDGVPAEVSAESNMSSTLPPPLRDGPLRGEPTVTHQKLPRRAVLQSGAALSVGALAAAGCANSGTARQTTGAGAGGALIALDKVPIGGVAAVTIDRRPAFVARPTADTVRAFSAVCTHRGCTVVAAGSLLMCPCHGSHYELLTGAVTRGPAQKDLPAIPVHLDGDEVRTGA